MQLACVFNLRERIRKMVEELGSGSPAERTSGSPRPGSEKVAAALAHIAGIRDQLAVVEHEADRVSAVVAKFARPIANNAIDGALNHP
jgi:hypothetical protein